VTGTRNSRVPVVAITIVVMMALGALLAAGVWYLGKRAWRSAETARAAESGAAREAAANRMAASMVAEMALKEAAADAVASSSGGAGDGAAPPSEPPQAAALAGGSSTVESLVNKGVGLMSQFEFKQAETVFADAALALAALRANDARSEENDTLLNAGSDRDALFVIELDRAIALLNQSEPGAQERAIAMLEAALAAHPTHRERARARYCLGLAFAFLGQPEQALPHFEAAAISFPKDATVAYQRGQSLEMLGRSDEALAQYQRALASDPFLRSALLGEQRLHARAGREAEAAAALDAFMQLEQNPRARLTEFKYTRMGALSEAIPIGGARERLLETGVAAEVPPLGNLLPGLLFAQSVPLLASTAGVASPLRDGVVLAIDLDGDGRVDLFVAGAADEQGRSVVLRQTETGAFERTTHALAELPGVRFAAFADFDNDGMLDALVSSSVPSSSRLMRCTGANMFEQVAEWRESNDALWVDLDHDGDLDLVLALSSDAPAVLMNRGEQGFEALDERSGLKRLPTACERMAAGDLNGDSLIDLVFLTGTECQVWLNDRFWQWRRDPDMETLERAARRRMVIGERAETGRPLVAVLTDGGVAPDEAGQSVALLEFVSNGERGDWSRIGAARMPDSHASIEFELIDALGLGSSQLLISTPDAVSLNGPDGQAISTIDALPGATRTIAIVGSPPMPCLIEWSAATQRIAARRQDQDWGAFVAVDFRGRSEPSQSMRSNADGIGTRWAARTDGRWNGGWVLRHSSGPGQGRQPALIGIGRAAQVDALFIDWPDGIIQSEIVVTPGAVRTITETQRQISSCPVIFAWDGERFAFETDCLGVGGLGYLVGATRDESGRIRPEYAPPRPRESVRLSTELVAEDGAYEIRLTEPMEEACYLDSARLFAWRVPNGWHLTLDERMGINGPEPTGEARFYRRSISPSHASAVAAPSAESTPPESGPVESSASEALLRVDHVAFEFGAAHPRYIGRLRESGTLTLTFPEPLDAHEGDPALVINGWVEYPYSQTSFAMWQASASPEAPSIDALDPHTGEWNTLVEQLGYPAGMTREALLPLTGDGIAKLPRGCTTLRIRTSVELFLDAVKLVWLEPCAEATRTELPLQSAEVAECGYPRKLDLPQKRPLYDYEHRAPLWDCRTQPGFYTRFGTCTDLVREGDGALAIFGPGEEIRMRFAPRSMGATVFDTARASLVFVLALEGWCKDMDRYTGDGATLGPLPTQDGAESVRDALHRAFNTRWDGGR